MKKTSFSLLDQENSEQICEQKVEELKHLRSKYGFLKNYYVNRDIFLIIYSFLNEKVAPSSKTKQKTTFSSNFSQFSSKNQKSQRTSPLVKIKASKLKSLISVKFALFAKTRQFL